jgi:hypothetical protein
VLGRFADLPEKGGNPRRKFRGPDKTRRPVAELQRQIRKLASLEFSSSMDEGAIKPAMTVAAEGEHAGCNLEEGRACFKRMAA